MRDQQPVDDGSAPAPGPQQTTLRGGRFPSCCQGDALQVLSLPRVVEERLVGRAHYTKKLPLCSPCLAVRRRARDCTGPCRKVRALLSPEPCTSEPRGGPQVFSSVFSRCCHHVFVITFGCCVHHPQDADCQVVCCLLWAPTFLSTKRVICSISCYS